MSYHGYMVIAYDTIYLINIFITEELNRIRLIKL